MQCNAYHCKMISLIYLSIERQYFPKLSKCSLNIITHTRLPERLLETNRLPISLVTNIFCIQHGSRLIITWGGAVLRQQQDFIVDYLCAEEAQQKGGSRGTWMVRLVKYLTQF